MFWFFSSSGSILCTVEGSCAGSSRTRPLGVRTWPTPSCPPRSLLSRTTTPTTRSCQLLAHLSWVSTSPSLDPMQARSKLAWSIRSLQRSAKGLYLSDWLTGRPLREGEAWSGLPFCQRYTVFLLVQRGFGPVSRWFSPSGLSAAASPGCRPDSEGPPTSNQKHSRAEGGLHVGSRWKDQDHYVGGRCTADR